MSRSFSTSVVIRQPAETVFDHFADHRNVAPVLSGVKRWEPIGRSGGVGARYRVELSALGIALPGVLVIDRWQRPEVIGWVSESGPVKVSGRFRFSAVEGGTRVLLAIDYKPPLASLGNFFAAQLDGVVRQRLHAALLGIKQGLE